MAQGELDGNFDKYLKKSHTLIHFCMKIKKNINLKKSIKRMLRRKIT